MVLMSSSSPSLIPFLKNRIVLFFYSFIHKLFWMKYLKLTFRNKLQVGMKKKFLKAKVEVAFDLKGMLNFFFTVGFDYDDSY